MHFRRTRHPKAAGLRYARCMTNRETPLTSGVLTSPADALLSAAIARTLAAAPELRADLFAQLVAEIEAYMRAHPEQRPWTCTRYTGTDGSHVFRGGVGHSLVIDASGTLWRARSYEDFDTTYRFVGSDCVIDSLTPKYAQMRRYAPRGEVPPA